MALSSPQQMTRVNIAKQGSGRFSGAVAPHIDKAFLNTAMTYADNMRQQQLEMVKTRADNDAENDVVAAHAELSQHEGLNALDKSMDIREKLQRQFEKRKEKIPEQFHPYVEAIYQKKMSRYNKFAIPYTMGEVKKVNDEAEKTYTANAMNEAVEDSGHPEEFSTTSLAKVQTAAARAARRQFGNVPTLVQAAIERTTSETIKNAISRQAVIGRLDNAQGLLNNHVEKLLPADREKVEKLLKQAHENLGDKEASDLAMTAFQDHAEHPEEAISFLQRSAKNDKVFKASKAFYDMKVNAAKAEKENRTNSIQSEIYKQAALGRDVQNLVYAMEPGEDRNKMVDWYNKTNGGKTILTDYKAVRELNQRISSAFTASQLPDDLLEPYRGRISPQDMKPFEEMYKGLKDKDNTSARRVHEQTFKIVQDTVESWAKANKVYDEERGRIELATMDEVDRILSFNPKITAEQLQARIRNVLREKGKTTKVKKGWIWDSKTEEVSETLAPDNSPTPHPYWMNEMQKLDPNLTEFQKNAVLQDLIRKGVDITKPK